MNEHMHVCKHSKQQCQFLSSRGHRACRSIGYGVPGRRWVLGAAVSSASAAWAFTSAAAAALTVRPFSSCTSRSWAIRSSASGRYRTAGCLQKNTSSAERPAARPTDRCCPLPSPTPNAQHPTPNAQRPTPCDRTLVRFFAGCPFVHLAGHSMPAVWNNNNAKRAKGLEAQQNTQKNVAARYLVSML